MKPNAHVLETLINLSRIHGYLELGDRCAELVEKLEPSRLNTVINRVEKSSIKKRSGIRSLHGMATNRIHEYSAGDANLPENDETFDLLRNLKMHMVERGYVCHINLALYDIEEESKEIALLCVY